MFEDIIRKNEADKQKSIKARLEQYYKTLTLYKMKSPAGANQPPPPVLTPQADPFMAPPSVAPMGMGKTTPLDLLASAAASSIVPFTARPPSLNADRASHDGVASSFATNGLTMAPHVSGSHHHASGSHHHASGSHHHASGSHHHASGSHHHASGSHHHHQKEIAYCFKAKKRI